MAWICPKCDMINYPKKLPVCFFCYEVKPMLKSNYYLYKIGNEWGTIRYWMKWLGCSDAIVRNISSETKMVHNTRYGRKNMVQCDKGNS